MAGTFTKQATFLTAKYLNDVSKSIIGGTYEGVRVAIQENSFVIYDGTTTKTPVQIAFNDLVGQVTWKAPNVVNITTIMRADLHVGDYVKLPPGQITTTAASLSQYRQGSVFRSRCSHLHAIFLLTRSPKRSREYSPHAK